jgi:hypothetical protein
MQSTDLTRDQAKAVQQKLEPMLAYLNKLRHRMQNKGFPLDDQLWITVSKAQQAMQDLMTELRCGEYKGRRPLAKRHSQPQNDGNERRGD